jgi:hypothetical protein
MKLILLWNTVPALAEKRRDAGNAISGFSASLCGFEVKRVLHGRKATSTIQ